MGVVCVFCFVPMIKKKGDVKVDNRAYTELDDQFATRYLVRDGEFVEDIKIRLKSTPLNELLFD